MFLCPHVYNCLSPIISIFFSLGRMPALFIGLFGLALVVLFYCVIVLYFQFVLELNSLNKINVSEMANGVAKPRSPNPKEYINPFKVQPRMRYAAISSHWREFQLAKRV